MRTMMIAVLVALGGCAMAHEAPQVEEGPAGVWVRDYVCAERIGSEWCPGEALDSCRADGWEVFIYDESVREHLDSCP